MKAVTLVALTLLAGVVLVTVAFYDRLPEPMPIHFDLHGRVDGWGSRALGAWLLPAVAAAILVAGRLTKNAAMRVALEVTSLFLLALQGLILRASLDGSMMLAGGLAVLLGAFDVVLGLIFPRLRRNRFVGIRLPWTLASDENWARTHRFGGALFVVAGVITLASVALLGGRASVPVALLLLLAASLGSSIYSYRIAHEAH